MNTICPHCGTSLIGKPAACPGCRYGVHIKSDTLEMVNHPTHYGGGSDPCEHHKVVYAWGLDYYLGNCTKYICRAGKKPGADTIQDLEKAKWYLEQEIALRTKAAAQGES
jgi:hypothetical protein